MAQLSSNVSYSLLKRMAGLLICSRCFRRNVRKPLNQMFSKRHRLLPLCPTCSGQVNAGHSARVLEFRQPVLAQGCADGADA